MEHTESITIDSPASGVWPLIGDVRAWPKWLEDISDVEVPSDDLAVGTEFTYKYKGRDARATVQRYEEGTVLGIGAAEKSWDFSESLTLAPRGEQTEVTFSMGFDPTAGWAKALGVLLTPFKGPLLVKPLRRELASLKSVVESPAA